MHFLNSFNLSIHECSLKSLLTPKSPKGDFFKLLIFSSPPSGVRGKNGKNQQFEGFLYCTHPFFCEFWSTPLFKTHFIIMRAV
ncbi:hypothetical protein [Anaerophaga thermohalophila]|uniref:hypothetical protein n=1 Tax=Anaerophaga thermohalophila TaxID=177400 RepID=UPI000A2F667A